MRGLFVPFVILLCGLIYLVATPLDGSGDEDSHLIRMIGLSHGDLLGRDVPVDTPYGAFSGPKLAAINKEAGAFEVPQDIVPLLECTLAQQPAEPWTCPRLPLRPASELHISHHARVLPTTYLLPAVLSRLAGGTSGKFFLGRLGYLLQNVALVGIASAAIRRARLPWSGLTTSALVLACTPVLLWQTGLIAPSSTENFAYIAFVAAAVTALRLPTSRWWIGATLLGTLAALCRDLGFVFAPLLLGVLLLFTPWRETVKLFSSRARLVSLLSIGSACVLGLVWRLRFESRTSGVDLSAHSIASAFRRLGSLSIDAVARLGWLDIPTQHVAGVPWATAVVAVWGTLLLRSLHWVRVIGLAVGAWCAVNMVLILVINAKGFTWFGTQARYTAFLPVCFVLIGLATARCADEVFSGWGLISDRSLLWATCVVASTGHLITYFRTAHRWANGLSHPMDLGHAAWSPPGGWSLMTFLAFVDAACLVVLPFVLFPQRSMTASTHERETPEESGA